jgi:non-heme chloroperoxidase
MADPGTPVLFVHGLWLHSSSWSPWVELFRAEGYAPIAPGWPGYLRKHRGGSHAARPRRG